jgi:hypothetical protein
MCVKLFESLQNYISRYYGCDGENLNIMIDSAQQRLLTTFKKIKTFNNLDKIDAIINCFFNSSEL